VSSGFKPRRVNSSSRRSGSGALPDNTFDLILLVDVYHEFSHPVEMLAAMKPYLAPPPPGAQPSPLWGQEEHVSALFGDRVTDLAMRRQATRVDCFATPEEYRDLFKTCYGPTVSAYRGIAEDPERVAALDRALADLARRHDRGTTSTVMDWEYLLLTARRQG